MGKKINPKVFRTGVIRTWPSIWFKSGQNYINSLQQDTGLRKYLKKTLREAGIDEVRVERDSKKISIDIHTAKPGLIIGRGGAGIEELKKKIHGKFFPQPSGVRLSDININIKEVSRPNLSAEIVLQSMILDLEKRVPYKKVMKQTADRIQRAGALGVRIIVSGRLNGAEIARSEKVTMGKVPLQTLRADVDYARSHANTPYGAIGIKVWIYKGEVFEADKNEKGEVVGKANL
ncbi:MAG: 30S ribosomal protein S3 [Patescibacteria group bacterium]